MKVFPFFYTNINQYIMKSFRITLQGKELDIKLSFRSLMTYEKLSGKNYTQISDLQDTLIYLYSCIISSNKGLEMDWERFLDAIDEEPESLESFLTQLYSINKPEGDHQEKK